MEKNRINEKNNLFDEVVNTLLSNLKERSREIFVARFGLDGSGSQVLGAIGKKLGVTRERIRQIEKEGIKKIKKKTNNEKFDQVILWATEILEKEGGFCEKERMGKKLDKKISNKEKSQLELILNCCDTIGYRKGSVISKGFWFIKKKVNDREVVNIHRSVVRYLKKNPRPVTFAQVKKIITEIHPRGKQVAENENQIRNIIFISRLIGQNILGNFGMKSWPAISQRGNRERAYLVLKREGKPLHFREISRKINESFSGRKSLPQTVHNELIKDKRFVLAGRGIYALSEWGYSGMTVSQVICQIMEKAGRPLDRDEIVVQVLKVKKVKKMTVLVNLADRKVFSKNQEGKYFRAGKK